MTEGCDRDIWHAFQVLGYEVEYVLVDQRTLVAMPLAAELLRDEQGEVDSELSRGRFGWSNELVSHVIELKLASPTSSLQGLASALHGEVVVLNRALGAHQARLLPTAMHPFFDPERETRLWPYESGEIYRAFDQLFGCRGHGWSNLQSVHLNLPFFDDAEFGRLHAACRVLLPLLPMLAASSPLELGRPTGYADTRLVHYRSNSARVPMAAGQIIPEPVSSEKEFQRTVIQPLAKALAEAGADPVLDPVWVNARGAMARFDRHSVELRLLDVQECPLADCAVAELVVAIARCLYENVWSDSRRQNALGTERLSRLLQQAMKGAERVTVDDREYLALFGLGPSPMPGSELLAGLLERVQAQARSLIEPRSERVLGAILREGCLAHRILGALGDDLDRASLTRVYQKLADCLRDNQPFLSGWAG